MEQPPITNFAQLPTINLDQPPPTNLEQTPTTNYPQPLVIFDEQLDNLQEPYTSPALVDDADRQRINVRRRRLYDDATRAFKRLKTFDKCLKVDFLGEEGGDYGGLTREMFSLYFDACQGKLVQGPEESLSLIHNIARMNGEEYRAFGRAVGLSILHGCGMPLCFGKSTVEAILQLNISGASIQELPDFELQTQLKEKVLDHSTSLNIELILRQFPGRLDLGFPESEVGVSAAFFTERVVIQKVVYNNGKEIQQITAGLRDTGLLNLLQAFPKDAFTLLCVFAPLTAGVLQDCLEVKSWADEADMKSREADIMFNFKALLEDLEDEPKNRTIYPQGFSVQTRKKTEDTEDTGDTEEDTEEDEEATQERNREEQGGTVVTIDLKAVFAFFTGSHRMTRDIRRDKIQVCFKHLPWDHDRQEREKIKEAFIANSCNKSVTFPVTERYVSNFEETFISDLIQSPGFTRV